MILEERNKGRRWTDGSIRFISNRLSRKELQKRVKIIPITISIAIEFSHLVLEEDARRTFLSSYHYSEDLVGRHV